MTPEEEAWSRVLGGILAVIFLFFVVVGCVMKVYLLLDDPPAPRPSEWRKD